MRYDDKIKKVTFDVITPKYDLTQKVHVDGDKSITMVVTGFLVRAHQMQFEVSWFHNGTSQSAWVDEFRMSAAEV